MSTEERLSKNKLELLKLANYLKNVSKEPGDGLNFGVAIVIFKKADTAE